MKRFLSLFAALCLAAALAFPAFAEEPEDMEAALETVTAQVKETLDIDDGYTEFSGSWNDSLRPGWSLYWSATGRDLSVSCDPDGLITEAYRWENAGKTDNFYGYDAAFPAVDEDDARDMAEEWLGRLMGEGETARIDDVDVNLTKNGQYWFSGRILMEDLESPVTFSIRIGEAGLMAYDRSDSYKGYVGELPGETPAVTEAEAAAALKDAVAMELYYVTDAGGEARLRYVPAGPYTVVDAQSGEAVDMDALYASFDAVRNDMEMPAAEAAMASADTGTGRGLTETELNSIANYRDVMDKDALDAAVRALPDVGLEDFQMSRCSYRLDGETGVIRAELQYTAKMDESHLYGFSRGTYDDYMMWDNNPVVTKYITMDAKSGTLESISTSYPMWEDWSNVESAEQERCEEFLAAAAPDRFASAEPCSLTDKSQGPGATFVRTHEGYAFPENFLYVYLNPGTGTVDEFRSQWDEEVKFAKAKGVVDEASAIDAYVDALSVTLGYTAWPEDIDWSDPVIYRYGEWGYAFVESLRLAWYYSGLGDTAGVDALTGEPVVQTGDGNFIYSDLDAVPKKLREQIERLGGVGVGFAGGAFDPERTLTQREAICLLLQSAGLRTEEWSDETLRDEAVWQGFLPDPAAWAPEQAVSRMEFLRMILGASRYGAAMELSGIWTEDYADVDSGDAGCAAIAEALGMVPSGRTLEPETRLTRADAAELLYAFMVR